jgi:polar amino acid transport system ATP-binding protein
MLAVNREMVCPTMSPPVLSLRQIRKSYDSLEVLKGVDLTAYEGDVVSLIGSSGSGKSTLLRCINMLEISQAGDIEFCGEAVRWTGSGADRMPADRQLVINMRTQLAMVFQQFNLWTHMTVLKNVIEAPVTVLGRPRDEAVADAMEILGKVGIADKADSYPAQLSGGQQQRAAIARALAMKPRALLFDEPTSALDPELEQEVIKVIRELAAEGRTMVIVTHDMSLARDVSSRVMFLNEGVVEEHGRPEDVLDKPKSDRLRQFLHATSQTPT